MGSLFAISDLHVNHPENREFVAAAAAGARSDDWLIVCGDVGDSIADVEWAPGAARASASPG